MAAIRVRRYRQNRAKQIADIMPKKAQKEQKKRTAEVIAQFYKLRRDRPLTVTSGPAIHEEGDNR